MSRVLFYRCLKSQYDALASVNPDGLYFLTDSGQIFLGRRNITECIIFVNDWSEVGTIPILGKFYLNSDTGELRCCDANGLRVVVPPISRNSSDFDDPSKRDYLGSLGSIREFVLREISSATSGVSNIDFDKNTGDINVYKEGEIVPVQLETVAHSPSYSNKTLTIPVYGHPDVTVDMPNVTEGEVAIGGTGGDVVSSGKTIGGPVLADPALDTVLATECAVKAAIDDARNRWGEIEQVNPHPGYDEVTLDVINVVQRDVSRQDIADSYPPSNVLDNNVYTVWYPAYASGSSVIDINHTGVPSGEYILDVDYVLGEGGSDSVLLTTGSSGSMSTVGGSQQMYSILQSKIVNNVLEHHGMYTLSSSNSVSVSTNRVTVKIVNSPDKYFGLGISSIKLYRKSL